MLSGCLSVCLPVSFWSVCSLFVVVLFLIFAVCVVCWTLQLAHRMVELQSALDPGRLSKRNKSSTHLLDAEKNRNACQAVRDQMCNQIACGNISKT